MENVKIELLGLPLYDEFFLDLVNNNYSQRTVDSYRRDLDIFRLFLSDKQLPFAQFGKLEISRYKEFLRDGSYLRLKNKLRKDKAPEKASRIGVNGKSRSKASRRLSMYSGRLGSRSVNRMLSALRSYFRFLLDADYEVPISPDSIKLVKTERKESRVAELDELINLVEAPEQFEAKQKIKYRNRAMLEVLFATGMRISELINLNREDLKISKTGDGDGGSDGGIDGIDSRIYILGKGKKQRFVYLTPRSRFYLERYLNSRKDTFPALFIPYRGLRSGTKDPYIVRISANYLQSKIKEYRVRLGIVVPTSAHSLRHGFATYLAENGANPAGIQKLLGHESLQTTSKYVHSSDRFAEKTHEDYHPLKNK
ncbi:MAG: tyrosine-type recombinase/integrase [Candidatus Dojkabacteria bacterium]